MNWIEANGVVLRYDLSGSGVDTVVLIHEAGGALESWDDIAPALQERFQVLCYDQRGFGMSERGLPISLESMIADLAALLDALGIADRPVHLVGTAIGGSIAMAFAARHPARVAGIVVSSPVTGGLSGATKVALAKRADTIEQEGMRVVADTSLARSYPVSMRQDPDKFLQYRCRFIANDPRSFAALTRTFLTLDLSADYAVIRCPALVIGCTLDEIKPARECVDIAATLPHGKYAEAASGHFIGVLSPRILLRLVHDFWDDSHAPQ